MSRRVKIQLVPRKSEDPHALTQATASELNRRLQDMGIEIDHGELAIGALDDSDPKAACADEGLETKARSAVEAELDQIGAEQDERESLNDSELSGASNFEDWDRQRHASRLEWCGVITYAIFRAFWDAAWQKVGPP